LVSRYFNRLEQPYALELDASKPAIYSPRVVLVFSVLFSPLAGGILAFYSLREAGEKAAARHVLWVGIGFLGLLLLLGQVLPRIPGLSIGVGYGCGQWFTQYLRKKLPDEVSYPRKSWVKPAIIWSVITTVVLYLILCDKGLVG
jgi:hypothetical protein